MEFTRRISVPVFVLTIAVALSAVPNANASLAGTVSNLPTQTVFPGLVPPGTDPGTLLASLLEPWSFATTGGTTSGSLTTAVFRESGGTLDFYYQVTNNSNSSSAIARETDTNFASQALNIATGFLTDGSALPGGLFVDGTVPPVTSDVNSTGNVVGFSFQPPDSAKITAGSTSNVFVISTAATNYVKGNASLIDGGTVTIDAFQPAAVPEPNEVIPLTMGLIALVGFWRFRIRRQPR